jgi:hypothetical protein
LARDRVEDLRDEFQARAKCGDSLIDKDRELKSVGYLDSAQIISYALLGEFRGSSRSAQAAFRGLMFAGTVIDRLRREETAFDLRQYWSSCSNLTTLTDLGYKIGDDATHFNRESQSLGWFVNQFSLELVKSEELRCIAETAAALALRQAEIDLIVANNGPEIVNRLELSSGLVAD